MKKDPVDLRFFPFDSTSWGYNTRIICPYDKLFYISILKNWNFFTVCTTVEN